MSVMPLGQTRVNNIDHHFVRRKSRQGGLENLQPCMNPTDLDTELDQKILESSEAFRPRGDNETQTKEKDLLRADLDKEASMYGYCLFLDHTGTGPVP